MNGSQFAIIVLVKQSFPVGRNRSVEVSSTMQWSVVDKASLPDVGEASRQLRLDPRDAKRCFVILGVRSSAAEVPFGRSGRRGREEIERCR